MTWLKALPKLIVPLAFVLSACGQSSLKNEQVIGALADASVLQGSLQEQGQQASSSSSAILAADLFKASLVTNDQKSTPVSDLILESGSWRMKYWVVKETDGDLDPIPWAAADLQELSMGGQDPQAGRASISLPNVSAEQIRVSPSFRPEDVQKMKNIDPKALNFLGLTDWDKKAREYWRTIVDLDASGGNEKADGLPILMSELMASSKSRANVVNNQGDALGSLSDFVLRIDGVILYAVVDQGEKLVFVPARFLSVDLKAKQFKVPVTKEVLEAAVGFEGRDGFPDLNAEHWDQDILAFWGQFK